METIPEITVIYDEYEKLAAAFEQVSEVMRRMFFDAFGDAAALLDEIDRMTSAAEKPPEYRRRNLYLLHCIGHGSLRALLVALTMYTTHLPERGPPYDSY